MNFSVYSADRATHLRIVVVALVASISIVGFSISVRRISTETTHAMTVDRDQQVKILRKKEALWIRSRDGVPNTVSACGTGCDTRSGS